VAPPDMCMEVVEGHGTNAWRRIAEWQLTFSYHSLHPTQYPWQHEKWHKTFDHGA